VERDGHRAERILGRAAVENGKAEKVMDDDLVAGLRRMGVTAADAREAVAASRGPGAVEERMRTALVALRRIYASRGRETRCKEPPWLRPENHIVVSGCDRSY
jgi:hypothetical protein